MDESEPLTTRNLLAELDFPVATGRRRAILEAIADALQPLHALIVGAGGPGEGENVFAMFHLASRSMSDLIASAHLASHAYLQQAYGALRPVYESCDLIELFARAPREASVWVNAEKPGVDFRPSKVRERISSPTEDAQMYGHVSEMGSHPRFAGSRVSGLMRVATNDPTDRRVVIRIGPVFPEHPAAVHVFPFIFDAVIRLGFKLRHLKEVTGRVTHDRWADAFLASAEAVAVGCKLARLELLERAAGEDSGFLDTLYDPLIAALQPGGDLRSGEPTS
jgi:hypothetical protein